MKFILLIPLMITYLLASADNPHKAFGTKVDYNNPYRCFSDLGYHQNTTTERISSARIESACYPLTSTVNGCKMKWNWSIDYKDSSVVEANTSCQYGCKSSTWGIHNQYKKLYPPVHTYRYCVKNNDWTIVARCVDKQDGVEADAALCNSASSGGRYYWKPKCEPTDTTEECEKRMMSYTNWTMCSKTSEVNNIASAGANSIYCYPYQRCYLEKNCDGTNNVLHSDYPSGGTAGESKKDPAVTPFTGKLYIKDSWDTSTTDQSFIHTKMSGTTNAFRIYGIQDDGTKFTNLGQPVCKMFWLTKGTSTSGSSISGVGNGEYHLTTTIDYSGKYAVNCTVDTDTGVISTGDVHFYAAPTSYEISNLRLNASNKDISIVDENTTLTLLSNEQHIIDHDSELWTKKPVAKIGSPISLVSNVFVRTANGKIDKGIHSTFFYASTFQSQAISTDEKLTPDQFPKNLFTANYGTMNVTSPVTRMDSGELVDGTVLALAGDDANLGTVTLVLQDTDVFTTIKSEEARGACGGNTPIECPYPGKLTIVFEYQVVPADFRVLLMDENDNFIKVLYFGQGHTPNVEGKSNIKFVALNKVLPETATYAEIMQATATNFTKGEAAQDMSISSFENTSTTGQYHIELSDGNSVISRNDFSKGVATLTRALKVTKRKDEDFTPNMEAEPVFPNSAEMHGSAEFYGYPAATTSYPEYTDIKAASDENMVILRGRINAIDSDSLATAANATAMQVYYEFQCKYCDVNKVRDTAGFKTDPKRSVSQQGWFTNPGFGDHSPVRIQESMINIEDKRVSIGSIGAFNSGLQEIHFANNGKAGTSQLKILHGNFCGTNYSNATACSDANTNPVAMPNFLLWAPYYNEGVKQHTHANIIIRNEVSPSDRSYGIDAPNSTKGKGRVGRF